MDPAGDDELAGGTGRDPVHVPRLVQVLALVLVVAAGAVVALRGRDGGPAPAPAPTSGPTGAWSSPPTPVAGTVGPPLTGPLRAPDLCVRTMRNTLSVQFTLENVAPGRVTVLAVTARLPIGGLEATGVQLPADGTCPAVAAAGSSLVLEPGAKVPVALRFRLPPECPAPYPVYADVELVGTGETPTSQQIPLLADLGGYDFTSCQT